MVVVRVSAQIHFANGHHDANAPVEVERKGLLSSRRVSRNNDARHETPEDRVHQARVRTLTTNHHPRRVSSVHWLPVPLLVYSTVGLLLLWSSRSCKYQEQSQSPRNFKLVLRSQRCQYQVLTRFSHQELGKAVKYQSLVCTYANTFLEHSMFSLLRSLSDAHSGLEWHQNFA